MYWSLMVDRAAYWMLGLTIFLSLGALATLLVAVIPGREDRKRYNYPDKWEDGDE